MQIIWRITFEIQEWARGERMKRESWDINLPFPSQDGWKIFLHSENSMLEFFTIEIMYLNTFFLFNCIQPPSLLHVHILILPAYSMSCTKPENSTILYSFSTLRNYSHRSKKKPYKTFSFFTATPHPHSLKFGIWCCDRNKKNFLTRRIPKVEKFDTYTRIRKHMIPNCTSHMRILLLSKLNKEKLYWKLFLIYHKITWIAFSNAL